MEHTHATADSADSTHGSIPDEMLAPSQDSPPHEAQHGFLDALTDDSPSPLSLLAQAAAADPSPPTLPAQDRGDGLDIRYILAHIEQTRVQDDIRRREEERIRLEEDRLRREEDRHQEQLRREADRE